MSWRTVVVTGNAKLDYKMEYLVVRKVDATKRVHLSEIEVLMIESTTVSITVALISELVNHKIKVIFCDAKHNPQSELMPYYGSHDSSGKVREQIKWDDEVRKLIWTDIITEKIRQQMFLLRECHLFEQAEMLRQYIEEVTLGDETNREGHAAKVYFNALFGKDFTRSTDCVVNAALNYGYGVVLSYFNRSISYNGYITQLGLFHDNQFNPFNLTSDLMEPFRILVDRKVYHSGFIKFEKEEKLAMIELMNTRVKIDGKKNTVSNAIRIYTKSVFDAIRERDIAQLKYYRYEL